jgi:hypothetical protein
VAIAEANAAADAGQYGTAARLAAQAAATEASPAARAKIIQWQLRWSVQERDTALTRAARRDLSAALAAIPDPGQWARAAHEASVFLADTGLYEDAYTLNSQLAGHLETVGGTEAETILASVLVNLGNAKVGLGRTRWGGVAMVSDQLSLCSRC